MRNIPRYFCLFCGVIFILVLFLNQSYVGAKDIDWEQIREDYMNFIENPNSVNAEHLIAILPESPTYDKSQRAERNLTIETIFRNSSNFSKLNKLAKQGDRNAINVLFKLIVISDGYISEEIDITLGSIINDYPKLFLASLKDNMNYVYRLDSLLGNLGEDFVDRFEEQRKELEKRYQAIQGVKDYDLAEIKDKCLYILSSQIEKRSIILEELKDD